MSSIYHRIKLFKQVIFFLLLGLFSLQVSAKIQPQQQEANKAVSKLYHSLNYMPKSDMAARLEAISAKFLGKVYLLGALGEGSDARFDQEPMYRMDAFDCETYVTTVLALALANDAGSFQQCQRQIRYLNGQVGFTTRHHFTSLDWNLNNQRQGFVKDITQSFKDQQNNPVTKIASALIDKPSWYQHLKSTAIRLHPQDEKMQAKRLAELKVEGSKLAKTNSQIPYIPLDLLFDEQGQANQYLFAQIPNAAIVEIIRPDWNLHEQIGTNLNVSHLGFVFWHKGVLLFREASSQHGQVIDIPLIDYLREAKKSPTIKGINVQIVVPQTPTANGCT